MKNKFLVLVAVLLLNGCAYDPNNLLETKDLSSIFSKEEKLESFYIDVRSENHYLKGHKAKSINIPLKELKKSNYNLSSYEDNEIQLIGNFERESESAAKILRDNGFTNVFTNKGYKESTVKLVKYKAILGEEFKKLLDEDIFIIDTRERKDYDKNHIDGAVNIVGNEFADYLHIIPKNKAIYIYGYKNEDEFATVLSDYRKDVTLVLEGTDYMDYGFN